MKIYDKMLERNKAMMRKDIIESGSEVRDESLFEHKAMQLTKRSLIYYAVIAVLLLWAVMSWVIR